MNGLTFEATLARFARLARAGGGTITAFDVEHDPLLARDRGTTSAASRKLASGTDVVATAKAEPHRWFPYAELRFERAIVDGQAGARERDR